MMVMEGDNFALLSQVDPTENLQNRTVEWKKMGLSGLVFLYRHRKQDLDDQSVQFKDRTTFLGNLSTGIVSVQVSSATLEDTGEYRFYVTKRNLSFPVKCFVNVIVVNRTRQNPTESSSTPVTEEPESEDPVAAKDSTDWRLVIIIVIVIIIIIVAAVFLWNRKAIWKKVKGWRTATPGVGMETVTTQQTEAGEERRVEAAEPLVADEDRAEHLNKGALPDA
ncbi:uncharacterized protein LOC130189565 isoform X2 [Pseudoliparis swirei]|nr:uncharacterized protein LOC130189565 isoform X2 [Pseudoliparis swirei]XP_056264411.1 uncharacterized protein LOC130189565 isoform X2 [Pseudoliparis swirei]